MFGFSTGSGAAGSSGASTGSSTTGAAVGAGAGAQAERASAKTITRDTSNVTFFIFFSPVLFLNQISIVKQS
jgi:hypothetical protein